MSGREEAYNEFERNSNNGSFVSSVMSKASENTLLSRITKIGVGIVIPPALVIIFSGYAYILTLKYILLIPAFISIFALAATILLIYLSRNAEKESKRVSDYFFYSIYCIHFTSAAYLLTGSVLVFVFSMEANIQPTVGVAIFCIEGACGKFIFGYAGIFILSRKLAIEYQNIRNFLQIIQISILLCGVGIFIISSVYKSS